MILIDVEAYERPRNACRAPEGSFSEAMQRGVWPPSARTAAALLAALEAMPTMSEAELDRLDAAQAADRAPDAIPYC